MALPDTTLTAKLKSEEECVTYLEQLRWPAGIACPNCGNTRISKFQAKGKSGKVRQICQCLDRECKYQFSATTGTIFHDSHLPLSKWYEAMRLMADGDAAVSVNQLRFVLDVQYKTAKNVAERIQRALEAGTIEIAAPTPAVATTAPAAEPAAAPVARPMRSRPKHPAQPPPAVEPVPTQASGPAGSAQNQNKPMPSPTVVDSMISVMTSAMNLGVKPPLAAVKYLKKKILN
jgi:hypothetical protein